VAVNSIRVRTSSGWQDIALVGPPGPPGPPGASGTGAGDVAGPASSVADRIAVFNGTSGKVIKDGGVTIAGLGIPTPASVAPIGDGTATAGISLLYARQDHVHPTDTTRAAVTYVDSQDALKANLASPTFTGDPKAPTPTAGDNDTSIATTAFVTGAVSTAVAGIPAVPAAGTAAPLMDSVAATGAATKYAREDHVHPSDTSRAPLASPVFTGNPTAPTPAPGDNDTSVATTAFVANAVATVAVSPSALTRTNDTNVTATLGGTPAAALLQATSITLGWTGTLATGRGGLGMDASASNGVPLFTTGVITMTGTTGTGTFVRSVDPVFTGNPTAPTATAGDNDTTIATTAFVTTAVAAVSGGSSPATVPPIMDGAAAVGVATKYAREDHVHPSDTSRAPLASPVFTGNPTAPTPSPGDNDTSIATTAFVTAAVPVPATVAPIVDGTAAVGVATKYAREDHVHPTNPALAPLASPVFTGDPKAPTASAGDSDTSIATTAFVQQEIGSHAVRYDAAQSLTGAQQGVARKNAAAASTIIMPSGRLSFVSNIAVPTSANNAVGANTLYWTPYLGSQFPFYDGTMWYTLNLSQVSVLSTDTTKNPSAIGVAKVNDWFLWDDAGTVRLTHGPDWTSDTARSAGTALVSVNGILMNSVAITNGPGASRGVFVGTTRSSNSSLFLFYYGSNAAGGSDGKFYLWNMYNRVNFASRVWDDTGTWTYSANTPRMMNNSGGNRISFVAGLQEDAIAAAVRVRMQMGASGGAASAGLGVDNTGAIDHIAFFKGNSGDEYGANASALLPAMLGAHFIQACENADSATSTTFVGGGQYQSLFAQFRM
jgi:hypothetical protein